MDLYNKKGFKVVLNLSNTSFANWVFFDPGLNTVYREEIKRRKRCKEKPTMSGWDSYANYELRLTNYEFKYKLMSSAL